MSDHSRHPVLDRHYLRYLDDEDSAAFIVAISRHYTIATLERLARYGQRLTRRGAVLALGLIGGPSSNAVLAAALCDSDRIIRMLAENGIHQLWQRDAGELHRQRLDVIMRWNHALRLSEVLEAATELINEAPQFAEVWNQRAIANYRLQNFEQAAQDCQQTLALNPYHFGAMMGMAHCYLEMGDGYAALECFRQAIELNPDLDGVRSQIEYLERALKES